MPDQNSEVNGDSSYMVLDHMDFEPLSEKEAIAAYEQAWQRSVRNGNNPEVGYLSIKRNLYNGYRFSKEQIIKKLTTNDNIIDRLSVLESGKTKILDGNSRLNIFSPQNLEFGESTNFSDSNIQRLYDSKELSDEFSHYIYESLNLYPEILVTNNGQGEISLVNKPLSDASKKSHDKKTITYLQNGKRKGDVSDGIKAFIGILLELVVGDPEILLIDELEAFLHAPLARKLGSIISKVSKNKDKQVFVTTHNTNFITGCIDSRAEFNILRLTYDHGEGKANVIETDEIRKIIKNPLLRSSGVFEGLFYKNVIVCEADSDRLFYQEINYRLKEKNDNRSIEDSLFINARNKQTVGDITKLLRKFGIPTASVIDFDFIRDGSNVFTKYLETNGMPESLFESNRINKAKILSFYNKQESGDETINKIDSCIDEYNKTIHKISSANNLKNKIRSHLDRYEGKNIIKNKGITVLQDHNMEAATTFLEQLNGYGLFPVPVGEAEGWLSKVTGGSHGNDWIITKLENMGEDENSKSYVSPAEGDVWDFISNINKWLINTNRKGMN